jgi:2,3,4,5-tetrahydropyridine-2-carboxylate N-succinyltransferase
VGALPVIVEDDALVGGNTGIYEEAVIKSRVVSAGRGPEWGLSLATPVIVKYRDSRTDTRTELEAWLR